MTATARPATGLRPWLLAVLRGEDPGPPAHGAPAIAAECTEQEVGPLIQELAHHLPSYAAWPDALRHALDAQARYAAARELAVRVELTRVLSALHAGGMSALLFKGAALAYSVYEAPSHRTRDDTDLLLPPHEAARSIAILESAGYTATPYSAGEELFGQRPLVRTDQAGVEHWIDVHWALSVQKPFADALTHSELWETAISLPALGPHARAPRHAHALLLACIHPVMHHRNAARMLWTYDVHRIAQRMDAREWAAFSAVTRARQLRAVVTHSLTRAIAELGTPVPPDILTAITPSGEREATAAYLEEGRGWLDELGSNLAGRAGWRSRVKLLQEVAFPSVDYLLASYGVARGPAGWIALPFLYVHRAMRGMWRLASGRK